MNILIDSTVWSIGLRRRRRNLDPEELKVLYEWRRILLSGDAAIIGLIRQEVLSGISILSEFESVKLRLGPTPDLLLNSDTYILAAEFFNICRAACVAAGPIDMTICAAANVHATPIFTTDPDFTRYAKHLPITLHTF